MKRRRSNKVKERTMKCQYFLRFNLEGHHGEDTEEVSKDSTIPFVPPTGMTVSLPDLTEDLPAVSSCCWDERKRLIEIFLRADNTFSAEDVKWICNEKEWKPWGRNLLEILGLSPGEWRKKWGKK
jgi:hypothetical protein